ncbi:MAG: tetratricopeptide repeat protein [Elusimicrobiota bacterium]|jgi:tetratricopeptide (TPR) repeat protein|nr:tetratricopeptide repeat protein [Elusimicrobiota bacterium]
MKRYLALLTLTLVLLTGCGNKSERQFKKAVRYNAVGDTTAALRLYNNILRDEPDYFPALLNRAIFNETIGEFKQAEADYKRAYSIDPSSPELLNNMGAFYTAQKQPYLALVYLNRAIAINQDYYLAYVNRAAAYSAIRDYDEALADLNEAISIYPETLLAIEQRAVLNLRRLRPLEAIEDFNRLIHFSPYEAKHYYYRGLALKSSGRYGNALQDFDTAVRLNPRYVDALYQRAVMHFKNVDHYSALGDLNTLKTINNKYVPAYELSGDILAIEDPVAATQNYLAARRLDPDNSRRYNAKIALMRTGAGRERVIERTFWES